MAAMLIPQVKDNGLLCHQAVEQLTPLLRAEATAPGAAGALQWLNSNGADMLEKPSMWIIVSGARARHGSHTRGSGVCRWPHGQQACGCLSSVRHHHCSAMQPTRRLPSAAAAAAAHTGW